jgi:hypothetical protein
MSEDTPIDGGGGGGGVLPPNSPMGPANVPADQTAKMELLTATMDRPVVLAYGRHIVGGNLILQDVDANSRTSIFVAHGEGEWDGPERIWVNGVEIDLANTSIFHFHPGLDGEAGEESNPATRNAKVCSFFPAPPFAPRLTFGRTAYSSFSLAQDPNNPGPGYDIRGVYRTTRVRIFDNTGTQTSYAYSVNPSWITLDLLLRRFFMPHSLINEALPTSVKNRIDFAAWKDWADYCDATLHLNGVDVKRWEAHPAFVDATNLLQALELTLLLGRAYLLEKNGQFAAIADKPRSSLLTLTRDRIGSESLSIAATNLRAAANQFVFKYRALDSGAAANDPMADFQPQRKIAEDEDHQDRVGRVLTMTVDLGNSTGQQAERLAEFEKRRTLDYPGAAGCRVLADTPGLLDVLPGDVMTAPAKKDYSVMKDYQVKQIAPVPDGKAELQLLEFDNAMFVDTVGDQLTIVSVVDPGSGFLPNATQMKNVLQNASFFRGGVSGQEGTTRPKFWKEYSNAGGAPAVTADIEHLLDDDRVWIKTKTSGVDKIGVKTLWGNLGDIFKPANFVALALSLRHAGSGGTYDKDVKFKLDNTSQDFVDADGNKFQVIIPAGTIPNTFALFRSVMQIGAIGQVPSDLNFYLWSEALGSSHSNEDLELDWVTLAPGKIAAPFDPIGEVNDADITWDSGSGLYLLPSYLLKGGLPTGDSGGAGGSSAGGVGGSDGLGGDRGDGTKVPVILFTG